MATALSTFSYKSLPSGDDGETIEGIDEDIQENVPKRVNRGFDFKYLAILICALCTATNVVFSYRASSAPAVTRKSMAKLRRPNQYIGLENIPRPTPPIARRFVNYPSLLTQVNSSAPTQVFPDDPKRYMSWRGTVSPEDRPVLVTPTVSTIVQFRAIDFGMEECELSLVVPSEDVVQRAGNSTLKLGSGRNSVDLWRLSAPDPVDPKVLSWRTRPSRAAKLATFEVGHGTAFSRRFACPQDSLHTFELVGADDASYVEWWQDKDEPLSAIYITQISTV